MDKTTERKLLPAPPPLPFAFCETQMEHLSAWLSPCAPVEVYHHDDDPPEQRWLVVIVQGSEALAEEVAARLGHAEISGPSEWSETEWIMDVFPREAGPISGVLLDLTDGRRHSYHPTRVETWCGKSDWRRLEWRPRMRRVTCGECRDRAGEWREAGWGPDASDLAHSRTGGGSGEVTG